MLLVIVMLLTLSLNVEAATIQCVVDESGTYISGSRIGQYDEDLFAPVPTVVAQSTQSFDLDLIIKITQSNLLIYSIGVLFIIFAFIGLIGGFCLRC